MFDQAVYVEFPDGPMGDQFTVDLILPEPTMPPTPQTVMAKGVSIFACGGYRKSQSYSKYLIGLVLLLQKNASIMKSCLIHFFLYVDYLVSKFYENEKRSTIPS